MNTLHEPLVQARGGDGAESPRPRECVAVRVARAMVVINGEDVVFDYLMAMMTGESERAYAAFMQANEHRFAKGEAS